MTKQTSTLKNQNGLATIESIVLLILFIVILSYAIGFFGIIHSGIKNSIGARSLAFETFRNRANVSYWRDNLETIRTYKNKGFRNHAIISENSPGDAGSDATFAATARQVAFVRNPDFERSNVSENIVNGRESQSVNSVFIKTKYGICLNKGCGD